MRTEFHAKYGFKLCSINESQIFVRSKRLINERCVERTQKEMEGAQGARRVPSCPRIERCALGFVEDEMLAGQAGDPEVSKVECADDFAAPLARHWKGLFCLS